MKKVLLTLALPVCLVMGQDQPELPGWGVYVGYGMMGASVDEDAGDLETISAPGFGVSKGLMLGGLPLQVGLGIHPRGYKSEFEVPAQGSRSVPESIPAEHPSLTYSTECFSEGFYPHFHC